MDYILLDEFLPKAACQSLIKYFEDNIKKGSNVNPMFSDRVVYYEQVKDIKIKSIMKNIHDRVASLLTEFYKLDVLYPEATHLVKWIEGSSLGSHADNAYDPSGEPNYVHWRTHSAVIYLNEEFTGGEFYFKRELPKTIQPKTGLLVAFTAGMDHVHGVQIVKSGNRYTMPLWFCQDVKRAYS
jgi:2OG-Fe(II) oxygenase superfamily